MERGKFVESKITSDDSLSLANLQNIYFKNVGATDVRIGLFVLKPAQDRYIKTGNTTLDQTSLDINFLGGLGKQQDLYVSYIKMPDCTCD
ncbi:hypothetical protein [uncultured Tenacibaculum sp.]|uniref:hypothetical protein n=1 Tax=uncultured Tenacibaculum sp. TaxID=174713 RepID=UPI00260774AE|nr:hypothetical protein [uncultured Tenacibaculum sp.]